MLYPRISFRHYDEMGRVLGNDLDLGHIVGRQAALRLTAAERATHLYVCGATGTGKSKMLEHLIRQDIKAWRKSKCGLLLLDPHGSLYDGLMRWLAWNQGELERPIIPIDLRRDDWVIAYNLLRPRPGADPAVIISQYVQAMAHVWGQGGTDETPRFERWVSTILGTLYEKELTLLEAEYLIDAVAKRIRQAITADLKNRSAARNWRLADALPPKDFEAQLGSTANRLHRFLSTEAFRLAFGQTGVSLDLSKALEEGHIILVSLATEGNRVSEEDAALFATLLLSDLWASARQRGKSSGGQKPKPFYVYIDEFQNFVTPTIAKNLDQARGFGLHLTLAHQFPNQLLHTGPNGEQVYDSIMENARTKIVFGLESEDNLRPLAQSLFMGTMSPDKIKHELYSTKVMDYAEEYRTSYSHSSGRGTGGGSQHGSASGHGAGGTEIPGAPGAWNKASKSTSDFASSSHSDNQSWSQSHGEGQTDSPMLVPIMGKELSSVQYEPMEEQVFRAMAVLHDQQQRHCVARIVGEPKPVSLVTPSVTDALSTGEMVNDYAEQLLAGYPFALRTAAAQKHLTDREAKFTESAVLSIVDEPETAKRKIK